MSDDIDEEIKKISEDMTSEQINKAWEDMHDSVLPPVGGNYDEDEDDDEVPEPPFNEPYPEVPDAPYKGAPLPPGKGYGRKTIRHLVTKRWLEVDDNPELRDDPMHRMDHSDIFYTMRTMLSRKGYNVSSFNNEGARTEHYDYIKQFCKDDLGIKRHQIGIFAADRAVMAYQGERFSVSYENCKKLAEKGVDIICIEKEGIVEKLTPFTDGVGIALVQSQGFMSEYGLMLAKAARKSGANVMVLTDFDVDGIKIAIEVENVTRIGIDFESINQINELLQAEFEDKDPFKPKIPPPSGSR